MLKAKQGETSCTVADDVVVVAVDDCLERLSLS